MAISPADPNRAAQAAEHIADADASWFGHPRQLARLFTTEMWERFGFYGMRALLVLYLTDHFLFSDTSAGGTYGAYMSLVYLTPFIGGFIADRYLGSKRSVKFGAIIMAIGYFTLCFGGEAAKPYALVDGQRYEVQVAKRGDARQQYLIDGDARLAIRGHEDGSVDLVNDAGAVERKVEKGGFVAGGERSPFFTMLMLIALSAIVVGNGFFKPNISTIVGELYAVGDRRRDAGFTIFYMGINLGSLFSQILCPWLATSVGWWAGFLLAAIGMLCSWALIQFDGGKLGGYGERPEGANPRKDLLIYALSIAAIPLMWFLFVNVMDAAQAQAGAGIIGYLMALPILGKLLFITFLIAVPAILIWSWRAGSKVEFQMMLAAMVMIVFNVVFWTLFEQAGSSLTLFADRNTDLSVFGLFSLSAGQTQFFNAFFIVTLAPLFSIGWNALGRRGLEPSIPVKFAIALVGVGLGFLVLVWGSAFAGADFKVSIWWLALLYLIHSMAELCISPVGLSMITKLSIVRIVGLMMGVWFMSISVAQYVGGMIAQVASVETVGGQVTNLAVSLQTYVDVFRTIGLASIGLGVLLFILAFPIKRWMHGVQ
ncbi:peptide MFS transporter [Sphingobium lactosutens]|uniref:Amino acid transporter n=1 Tax=Sphingobium lactosutens DS20 TaxID=1331060 RepID=T0IZC8_9SPHN|nr:oligopeptide:H+ symporter [Sphingobium lactosutens]EQB17235.1 amino acid transporter [Sphingobium lactosutens DS20]